MEVAIEKMNRKALLASLAFDHPAFSAIETSKGVGLNLFVAKPGE